jgi:hypothetical protein
MLLAAGARPPTQVSYANVPTYPIEDSVLGRMILPELLCLECAMTSLRLAVRSTVGGSKRKAWLDCEGGYGGKARNADAT